MITLRKMSHILLLSSALSPIFSSSSQGMHENLYNPYRGGAQRYLDRYIQGGYEPQGPAKLLEQLHLLRGRSDQALPASDLKQEYPGLTTAGRVQSDALFLEGFMTLFQKATASPDFNIVLFMFDGLKDTNQSPLTDAELGHLLSVCYFYGLITTPSVGNSWIEQSFRKIEEDLSGLFGYDFSQRGNRQAADTALVNRLYALHVARSNIGDQYADKLRRYLDTFSWMVAEPANRAHVLEHPNNNVDAEIANRYALGGIIQDGTLEGIQDAFLENRDYNFAPVISTVGDNRLDQNKVVLSLVDKSEMNINASLPIEKLWTAVLNGVGQQNRYKGFADLEEMVQGKLVRFIEKNFRDLNIFENPQKRAEHWNRGLSLYKKFGELEMLSPYQINMKRRLAYILADKSQVVDEEVRGKFYLLAWPDIREHMAHEDLQQRLLHIGDYLQNAPLNEEIGKALKPFLKAASPEERERIFNFLHQRYTAIGGTQNNVLDQQLENKAVLAEILIGRYECPQNIKDALVQDILSLTWRPGHGTTNKRLNLFKLVLQNMLSYPENQQNAIKETIANCLALPGGAQDTVRTLKLTLLEAQDSDLFQPNVGGELAQRIEDFLVQGLNRNENKKIVKKIVTSLSPEFPIYGRALELGTGNKIELMRDIYRKRRDREYTREHENAYNPNRPVIHNVQWLNVGDGRQYAINADGFYDSINISLRDMRAVSHINRSVLDSLFDKLVTTARRERRDQVTIDGFINLKHRFYHGAPGGHYDNEFVRGLLDGTKKDAYKLYQLQWIIWYAMTRPDMIDGRRGADSTYTVLEQLVANLYTCPTGQRAAIDVVFGNFYSIYEAGRHGVQREGQLSVDPLVQAQHDEKYRLYEAATRATLEPLRQVRQALNLPEGLITEQRLQQLNGMGRGDLMMAYENSQRELREAKLAWETVVQKSNDIAAVRRIFQTMVYPVTRSMVDTTNDQGDYYRSVARTDPDREPGPKIIHLNEIIGTVIGTKSKDVPLFYDIYPHFPHGEFKNVTSQRMMDMFYRVYPLERLVNNVLERLQLLIAYKALQIEGKKNEGVDYTTLFEILQSIGANDQNVRAEDKFYCNDALYDLNTPIQDATVNGVPQVVIGGTLIEGRHVNVHHENGVEYLVYNNQAGVQGRVRLDQAARGNNGSVIVDYKTKVNSRDEIKSIEPGDIDMGYPYLPNKEAVIDLMRALGFLQVR